MQQFFLPTTFCLRVQPSSAQWSGGGLEWIGEGGRSTFSLGHWGVCFFFCRRKHHLSFLDMHGLFSTIRTAKLSFVCKQQASACSTQNHHTNPLRCSRAQQPTAPLALAANASNALPMHFVQLNAGNGLAPLEPSH